MIGDELSPRSLISVAPKKKFWERRLPVRRGTNRDLPTRARSSCVRLSHARVALPLDLCHLASHDIDFERSIAPDTACPFFERNFVMSGGQRYPEAALAVRSKRCDLALLVLRHESGVRQWP